jgi:hypothetical protein
MSQRDYFWGTSMAMTPAERQQNKRDRKAIAKLLELQQALDARVRVILEMERREREAADANATDAAAIAQLASWTMKHELERLRAA